MKRKPPALRLIGIDLNARSVRTFCCDYEVELVHGCCHRFLADYPFEGNELVYSDPPYLMSTRKSQRRYRYHYSDADHGGPAGVAQGPSLFGDDLRLSLGSLRQDTGGLAQRSVQVMSQAGMVTEKIWLNFMPDRPHWHTCAGRNFTDR
ncbi:MAG: hypothetical protein OXC26_25915 [Albidovulum sp.]|nr:hypothetical protein [Albidovulum sp.]